MKRWLYEKLLSLSFGGEVAFDEIGGYNYWSALCNWLDGNNIRYNVKCVGSGMYVVYRIKVDEDACEE